MDTRILKHYEAELAYLREMGAEFAESYPKVARRLGMDQFEVLDPYVERLLEGSAFLAARVQFELDQQFPEFTNSLLDIVYPHYLPHVPSMMIARLEPDMENGALSEGFTFERGTPMRSIRPDTVQTACNFVTACDLTLWPIEIAEAQFIHGRGELVAAGLAHHAAARSAIRLRLKRHGGAPISALPLDKLRLFLGSQGVSGWQLLELLGTQAIGLAARSTNRRDDWVEPLSGSVTPCGMDREEALLPVPEQSFDGYRLLQEYFAMPERYHFVELDSLGAGIRRAADDTVDLYILLDGEAPAYADTLSADDFSLNCVPAINLFERLCDRVPIRPEHAEHHVVVDNTATMDFEVHSILTVDGIGADAQVQTQFAPFFSNRYLPGSDTGGAFFAVRRRMRQRTEKERLKGSRTSYLGSETYLSLLDETQAPYSADITQLSVRAMVSNRDLPLILSSGAANIFSLPGGGPVAQILTPVSPTKPQPSLALGNDAWRLISHLSLNYLSLTNSGAGDSAAALREMLRLYAPLAGQGVRKQLEGIAAVESRPIVRRISDDILPTALRGLEIKITVDEDFFGGTSAYLIGAVLETFLRKYVSMNSFTETVLATNQRGEIKRWPARTGLGRMI